MNFKSIKGKSRFFILIKLIIAVQTHAENASTAEQKKHYKKIDLSRWWRTLRKREMEIEKTIF